MERILVVVGFLLLPIFSSTVDATVPASATPQSRAQLADGNGDTGVLRACLVEPLDPQTLKFNRFFADSRVQKPDTRTPRPLNP
jgi:hypothetical protein